MEGPSPILSAATILIAGAARRLGRAIALGATGQGARVVVHYHRSGQDAACLLDALHSEGGHHMKGHLYD